MIRQHTMLCPYDECMYRGKEPDCYDNYIKCPDFLEWHSEILKDVKDQVRIRRLQQQSLDRCAEQ